jgi:hypothetical protein
MWVLKEKGVAILICHSVSSAGGGHKRMVIILLRFASGIVRPTNFSALRF